MYCPQCGQETPANSAFCAHCGAPLGQPQLAAQPPAPARSGLSGWVIAAIIVGAVVIIAFIVAIVVIAVLTLLGPRTREIFGTVYNSLL